LAIQLYTYLRRNFAPLYASLIPRAPYSHSADVDFFEAAYNEAEEIVINQNTLMRWRVISYDDLITSKIKAGRPKDLLDIQELKRISGNK